MRKNQQLKFFKNTQRFFGGRLLYGKRKSQRPLSTKDALHFVMRSLWAKGPYSFLQPHNRKEIERLLMCMSKKYGVKIYRQSIQSNHIHLVIRISKRDLYKAFVRVLSGKIASHVMGSMSFKEFLKVWQRGDGFKSPNEPHGNEQQFWQFRPFTRVLAWGRDFKTCCGYVLQNTAEALGFQAYKERKNYYAKWIKDTAPDFSKAFV
jgi:REP element-mobilizing transposase RayT